VDADAVQENCPEQLDFKQRIFARIEQATRLDTLLLSSTSGIRATQIAEAMKQPGRLVVGHPFNPPHLIPLVEDLGSPRLDQPTVELLGEQARGDEPVAVLAAERVRHRSS
jgi:ketoreductase RED1